MSFTDWKNEIEKREPKGLSPEHREIAERVRTRYSGSPSKNVAQLSQASDGSPHRPLTAGGKPGPNVDRGPWCDQCGVEKKETNHWFEAHTDGLHLIIQQLEGRGSAGWRYLCGQECAHKELTDYLNQESATLGA